jgi:putative ABC transport system substrate-binding protein
MAAAAAHAQTTRQPTIGYLYSATAQQMAAFLPAVKAGLVERGFFEGKNVAVEYRTADGRYDRLAPLAKELVDLKPDVIFAVGGAEPAKALMAATTAIPIVFYSAADPVKAGLVSSIGRPGGNVTGVSQIGSALEAKRLDYLNRLVPGDGLLGALVNPRYSDVDLQGRELQEAVAATGRRLQIMRAGTEAEIVVAFQSLASQQAVGMTLCQDPFFGDQRELIVSLASQQKLPVVYWRREFVTAGGLMSYGPDFAEGYRQAGIYLGRILRGAKPAQLPVVEPTKFELVVNRHAASELGLEIPADILAGASDVLE